MTFQFYITQEVLIDIVTLSKIRVVDEKRSVFVRWLFTPDVCKILVYRWFEVNSGTRHEVSSMVQLIFLLAS